jgi:hypothetical protein
MKYGTASLWSFGLLMLPGTALAAWGENWGEMVWGLPVSVPSVPAVGLFVLALALLTTAAWRLRARKALHSALALLVVPMLAGVLSSPAHAQVTIPNTFTDGTPALASEVNENFQTLAGAVNSSECATSAEVACAISGDWWNVESNTCTPAPGFNCFAGGFCAQAAILFPNEIANDMWPEFVNKYEGFQQGSGPALAAGCNSGIGAYFWSDGEQLASQCPLNACFQGSGSMFPGYAIGNMCQ